MKTLRIALAATLVAAAALPALAGVPDPSRLDRGIPCDLWIRSSWLLDPSPLPCQYRFRADGGLDPLRVILTLRDCFDTPLPGCNVQATLVPASGTTAFCMCEPASQVVGTNPGGVAEFVFRRIGGHGSGQVQFTILCLGIGDGGLDPLPFDFTSPDLDASCQAGSSTTALDLALWVAGMQPYRRESDLDCNGVVNGIDLALWVGGLGRGCP